MMWDIVVFASLGVIGIILLMYHTFGIIMGLLQSYKYGVMAVLAVVTIAASYVGIYKCGYRTAVRGLDNKAVVTTVQDDKEN